jgi:hypothetical protein
MEERDNKLKKKETEVYAQNAILVILRGLPGSGKSHLAEDIKNRIANKSISIVDPDMIDEADDSYKDFTAYLAKNEPELESKFYPYRFLLSKSAEVLRQRGVVIWNQAFTDVDGMIYTARKLTSLCSNKIGILVVQLESSPDDAWKRVVSRMRSGGNCMSKEKFDEFVQRYKYLEEIPYPSISINTFQNYKDGLDEIVKYLGSLWRENEN